MKTTKLAALIGLLLALAGEASAEPNNPNTDWFGEAKLGVFMHFLPSPVAGPKLAEEFDVQALADQLADIGAGYFVLTLGQNSGWLNAPNSAYDKRTGYVPGERCSTRDLALEVFAALRAKDIRLMLYLPCQVPNQDRRAQRAFGLAEGPQDQPLNEASAQKWGEVIQEWSDRYGDSVVGWWFDGGYQHIGFNDSIAAIYAAAAKHGNPKAIVTFNPGVKIIRWTRSEDYTAGELNEPLLVVPKGRWLDGSQWHALTYVGQTWGARDTRFSDAQWVEWARKVAAAQGVITLDMGPNYDSSKGRVGALAEGQVKQVKAIREALGGLRRATMPRRLKRAESYFGIHFDFHAGNDCNEIGKNTTREMIENIITNVHPDYIQIDCKGHPGLSSYPTKVGNQAPGYVGDPLRTWREVTAEHGVGLYMHYSGVWDSEAIRKHPDWAVVNADGTTNRNATSFFAPYDEQLLIPQLRELIGDYGVDGAWVDGECWASAADYSDPALKAWRAATGFADVPRKPGELHWYEFLNFNREAFRNHLRFYIAGVKKTDPQAQLCSNWAFTDHMPEALCAPVDWISGDFTPEDAVNSARFSGRYIAQQGKPWDLMAWSFTTTGYKLNGSAHKPAVQLEREAAEVLSLGGGFQPYYNQRRDGSVPLEHVPVITELAKFCRDRQPFCQGATPVPQIALLYSSAAHYRETDSLFGRDLSRVSGTLEALLEEQQVVDVVSEHHLAGRMAEYHLIIVSECDYLEPAFKSNLVQYVRDGGNLLVVGPQAASLFASELGATLGAPETAPRYLASGDALLETKDQVRTARLEERSHPVGRWYVAKDLNSASHPAASITPLGKGRIAATYFSYSRGYLHDRSAPRREFLGDLVRQLFPNPIVEVTGSPNVDVSLMRHRGHLAVNLVNTSGPHADPKKALFDSIQPIGPLKVKIRMAQKPSGITLEPGGQRLEFAFEGGLAQITIPLLEIHSIIRVD